MTALNKQALHSKARSASAGEWIKESGDGWEAICSADDQANGNFIIAHFEGPNARGNREFAQAANPDTVLALLDELEAKDVALSSKDYHFDQDADRIKSLEKALESAEKRIAELEAREIKPAKGEVLVVVSGFTGCGKSAIAGEIEIAMKAIGVPVKWTNGDAEKWMTGADWLSAIEMYKPTVRIVEVNVPRAAGIGVKGE
ncbi:ead/Ea22-like family protein [Citrobacter portucalensis]|uniref:ead/Ea22-like family protein n=1 Tax=Citrobacter portucalensis TaxID=1639133 RepID=UPI003B26ADE2